MTMEAVMPRKPWNKSEPQIVHVFCERRCATCGFVISDTDIAHGPLFGAMCTGKGKGRRRYRMLISDNTATMREPTPEETERYTYLLVKARQEKAGQHKKVA